MQKCIMAVGGHIGDAELTCGGVLATYALKGYKIVTVGATGGERGNPPHISMEDYRVQKINEAKAFAEMLGGEAEVLPYCDCELENTVEARYLLCDIIRKHKPEFIMTHWKNSMHRDHRMCNTLVYEAQQLACLPNVETKYPKHFAPIYMAENWEDSEGYVPYVYMEVSKDGFELWSKAINTHWFALNSTSFKYKDYYSSLMRVRGLEGRFEYAETFTVHEYQKRDKRGIDKIV